MIRSLLYVPASAPRFIAKAHLRGADAIILDLEDAVAENEKRSARAALRTAVPQVGQNGARVFVRVNHRADGLLADTEAAFLAGAYGVHVPKVSDPAVLESLDAFLRDLEARAPREPMVLVPLIEDPAGVLNAQAIAACPRVFGLSTGAEDLATALGAQPRPDVMRIPKMLVHLAAKAAGRHSFGLFQTIVDYQDVAAMKAAIQEARQFGFDGATCIHPSVVPLLNEGFAPTVAEIDRARRLVAAAEQKQREGTGAFLFEGVFVDAPIVDRARALLRGASPL